MLDFSIAVMFVSTFGSILGGYILGTYMGASRKPNNGKAASWEDIDVIPMGVPFEIICRPSKLPYQALIRFFANQDVIFIDLPQPEPLMDFVPGKILSKMEKDGQPVLRVIQPEVGGQYALA